MPARGNASSPGRLFICHLLREVNRFRDKSRIDDLIRPVAGPPLSARINEGPVRTDRAFLSSGKPVYHGQLSSNLSAWDRHRHNPDSSWRDPSDLCFCEPAFFRGLNAHGRCDDTASVVRPRNTGFSFIMECGTLPQTLDCGLASRGRYDLGVLQNKNVVTTFEGTVIPESGVCGFPGRADGEVAHIPNLSKIAFSFLANLLYHVSHFPQVCLRDADPAVAIRPRIHLPLPEGRIRRPARRRAGTPRT